MLIIGINGSPNKEENTAFLLGKALDAAQAEGARIEMIHVTDALEGLKVPFCDTCCNPCEGACTRGNNMGIAYDQLRKADGLIIASPVYFGTVSGQMKAFWDKSRVLRKERALLNVAGGALAVGASRFGGQETTLRAIHDIMLVQGMTVIGDGHFDADAGHQGACAQRPAQDDENAVKRAGIIGRRVAEVARATSSLRRR
ncbi:flavodoxin family protein [bacterium]|nr:MAG: flavodoxin family protein [bacterium]